MATKYGRQLATVQRLIASHGEACTWWQYPAPPDDDAANPAEPEEPVSFPVLIVFIGPTKSASFFAALSALVGTEVPGGLNFALMGSVTFTPALTDQVERSDGTMLSINDKDGIRTLAPDGTTLLYYLRFSE